MAIELTSEHDIVDNLYTMALVETGVITGSVYCEASGPVMDVVVDEHERRLRRLPLKLASVPWGHLAMLDVSINRHANIPRIPL